MRILHVNCNYTGSALHQLMVEKLEQLGYENSIFVPVYEKSKSVITPNENVCVSACFDKWDRLFFDYKQEKIFRTIQETYRVSQFDCIHAYTLFTDGNCAMRLAEKYDKPFVVAVRNTDVNAFFKYRPHLRKRGIRIMRRAAAVFFLSEAYYRQVFDRYIPQKYHEELKKKAHIIPNGIDDFWLRNLAQPAVKNLAQTKEIKLIYAGRIDKNKNIPTIQSAAAILRERGYEVRLTVVGSVDDPKEFAKIQKDDATAYVEKKPKEALLNLYRAHDIFVMPSYTESFGLVYAEAMTQRLPVIYSMGQGFDRQFEEGTVGFHVDPYSADSVADAIENIVLQYDQIANSCMNAAQKFSWTRIAGVYDALYQQIRSAAQEKENGHNAI